MKKVKSDSLKKARSEKLVNPAFLKRAEDMAMNEIKKQIMENPELMKQLGQTGKDFSSESSEE